VALAIPFLLAAMSVASAGLVLTGVSISRIRQRAGLRTALTLLIVLLGLMTLWWAYLWSTYTKSGLSRPSDIAVGLTHWQNLNTGYVIPISLVTILGVWVVRARFRFWYLVLAASALLGLVAGFSGPSIALAVAGVAPLFAVGLWVLGDNWWWLKALGVSLITSLFLVASLLAPGSQNRATIARSDVELTLSSIPGWFLTVVPNGLISWFSIYWQWGSVLVIGSGLVLVYTVRLLYHPDILVSTGLAWLAVTLFSLALSASTVVTDSLTYGAYWHQSSTTTLSFLSLLLLGIGVGMRLPDSLPRITKFALPIALVAIALTTSANILNMSVSITDRLTVWEVGPAPIENVIADREAEWIETCWDQLEMIRGQR
jgi:hypothetical protein